MRTITATEFKNNLGKYLDQGANEDILITKNGKPLVKLVSANGNALERLFELEGFLQNSELSFDEARLEKIIK